MSWIEFENNDDGDKYNVEAICNSEVYTNESDSSHLPSLYYLVLWKDYLEKKNTWELTLALQSGTKSYETVPILH